MSYRQRGIVLLTTMMILVIVTLLILSLMQGVFLYIKSSHQIMRHHEVFRQMEIMATTRNLRSNAACVVQDKNPNQLVDMLSANQGCIIGEGPHQYRYIVDDLGLYPCLQLVVDEVVQGSHHWLVTLASMKPPKLVLQLRMVEPAEASKCELGMARQIHSGVISWRKINGFT